MTDKILKLFINSSTNSRQFTIKTLNKMIGSKMVLHKSTTCTLEMLVFVKGNILQLRCFNDTPKKDHYFFTILLNLYLMFCSNDK